MNASVLVTPRSLLARISRLALMTSLAFVAFTSSTPAAQAAQFVNSVSVGHPSGIVGTVAANSTKCTISATLRNLGAKPVKVTLVTYRMTEPSCAPILEDKVFLLKSQGLFDYRTLIVPSGPAGTAGVTLGPVALPHCAAHWDLILGDVIAQYIGSDFYQAFNGNPSINRVILGAFTYQCRMLSPNGGCITYAMLRDCDPVVCTYTQGGYSQLPRGKNAGSLLRDHFAEEFPQGLFIGASAPAGLSGRLSSTAQIREFIRTRNGTPGVLNSSNKGGTFASQLVTFTLNVAFNARLGGLLICNTGTSLDGQTVTQVLAIANAVIGNLPGTLPAGYTVSDLNDLVTNLNESYQDCKASSWAFGHLCEPVTAGTTHAGHLH